MPNKLKKKTYLSNFHRPTFSLSSKLHTLQNSSVCLFFRHRLPRRAKTKAIAIDFSNRVPFRRESYQNQVITTAPLRTNERTETN